MSGEKDRWFKRAQVTAAAYFTMRRLLKMSAGRIDQRLAPFVLLAICVPA
jgi:hypothetical protein